MDVCRRPRMAPRAGFEVDRKLLTGRVSRAPAEHSTPSDPLLPQVTASSDRQAMSGRLAMFAETPASENHCQTFGSGLNAFCDEPVGKRAVRGSCFAARLCWCSSSSYTRVYRRSASSYRSCNRLSSADSQRGCIPGGNHPRRNPIRARRSNSSCKGARPQQGPGHAARSHAAGNSSDRSRARQQHQWAAQNYVDYFDDLNGRTAAPYAVPYSRTDRGVNLIQRRVVKASRTADAQRFGIEVPLTDLFLSVTPGRGPPRSEEHGDVSRVPLLNHRE